MSNPTTIAVMAETNTAPAATSLTTFTCGLNSMVIRSIADSTAVLIISVAITKPIVRVKTAHSVSERFKSSPNARITVAIEM